MGTYEGYLFDSKGHSGFVLSLIWRIVWAGVALAVAPA